MVTAFSAAAVSAQPQAMLNVELNRPKAAVSPTLYGLMTEEINYSYDGGLYAELIRNRTFRSDWSGILNWYLIEKGSSSAKLTVDNGDGPSAALRNSAKIEVTKADSNSPAGLLNEGYWGMSVRPNTRYSGSFYAKAGSDSALPVHVALIADQSGEVLASTSVEVTGAAWKQYKFDLRSGKTSRPPRTTSSSPSPGPQPCGSSLFRCSRRRITTDRMATASTSWKNWRRCGPRSCASPAAIILKAIASRRVSTGRK